MFERIIASRLVWHLSREGPNLSDGQFDFREGHSTVDAILRVRSLSEAIVEEGRVALGVSLDITNAFNTLFWEYVGRTMEHHGIPSYIQAVVADYFRNRRLVYWDQEEVLRGRGMSCGVPQGSVLCQLM